MPGPTPRYPAEFKQEAVNLYRSSGRAFSEDSLRRWVKQTEIDHGEWGGLSTEEQDGLSRLLKEVKTLRQEKEILRKAQEAFGWSSSLGRPGVNEHLQAH